MTSLPDYNSPLILKAFLDAHDMAMQKKFGQNFLINQTARERLVDALDIGPGTSVWEIGPGLGAMTKSILDRGANVVAFEIDRGFSSLLREFFGENGGFRLIEGDVLKTWRKEVELALPSRLFGNLPYNVAAAIIGDMISEGIRFDAIVVTVQKEVALRMAAKPDTEDYSSFSVLCQWAYDVKPVMDLAGGSFWPRPNVGSRAVKMTKKDQWPRCASPDAFMEILRALFSSRRKTVKNNFAAYLARTGREGEGSQGADAEAVRLLGLAGIDPARRAETLSVDDFIRLSDAVAAI
jgi:16S rRNA (adenine1518-N6/adenine1519-N6)-dimethyltransferase